MRTTAFASVLLLFCLPSFAAIPVVVSHQGFLQEEGEPVDGVAQFRFAFVDGGTGTNLWTQDGTRLGEAAAPDTAVSLSLSEGLYTVRLGDTSVSGMAALASTVFNGDDVRLRIWVAHGDSGVQLLQPDQELSSVPYALHAMHAETATTAETAESADTLDGIAPADLEESAEIVSAIAAHASASDAHPNLELDASQITGGVFSLSLIPQGEGSTLDADTLDGMDSSQFATVDFVGAQVTETHPIRVSYEVEDGEQVLAGQVVRLTGALIHRGKSSGPGMYASATGDYRQVIRLSPERFILSYREDTNRKAVVCDVTDDSLTVGPPSVLLSPESANPLLVPVSESQFSLVRHDSGEAVIRSRVCSVVGNAIVVGAESTAPTDYGSDSTFSYWHSAGFGTFAALQKNGQADGCLLTVGDVSATGLSIVSAQLTSEGAYFPSFTALLPLGEALLCFYKREANTWHVRMATEDGGALTLSDEQTVPLLNGTYIYDACEVDDARFLVAYGDASPGVVCGRVDEGVFAFGDCAPIPVYGRLRFHEIHATTPDDFVMTAEYNDASNVISRGRLSGLTIFHMTEPTVYLNGGGAHSRVFLGQHRLAVAVSNVQEGMAQVFDTGSIAGIALESGEGGSTVDVAVSGVYESPNPLLPGADYFEEFGTLTLRRSFERVGVALTETKLQMAGH